MKISEQSIYDAIANSNSMREAASKLPINFKTFRTYAVKLGVYDTNPSGKGLSKPKPKMSLDDILNGGHPQYNSHRLKQRLIAERGWLHRCHTCGLDQWMGQPIPLELDHIDGNHYNQLESNLRFLCPNCHAQTPTYRNKIR